MRRLSSVLLVSMVLVVIGSAAAWVAVGRLGKGVESSLEQVEGSIEAARDLAAATAASAAEVETVLQVVGDGLGSTGDALAATRSVSENVRRLLGVVDFFDRVDDLKESLEAAEASLQEVETSLAAASTSVAAAAPTLHTTVVELEKIPDQLDATLAQARTARDGIYDQTALWRLAIVAGGLAVLGGLWSVRELARRQADEPSVA
jgi:predicted  nucleic acid-binding Zn-ribbon protein